MGVYGFLLAQEKILDSRVKKMRTAISRRNYCIVRKVSIIIKSLSCGETILDAMSLKNTAHILSTYFTALGDASYLNTTQAATPTRNIKSGPGSWRSVHGSRTSKGCLYTLLEVICKRQPQIISHR